MKRESIILVILLFCVCAGVRGQTTTFKIDQLGYEILTSDDGTLTDEVRIDGRLNSGHYYGAPIPDEVIYENKTYKVVEFVNYEEYGDRNSNHAYFKLALGKNIRNVEYGWEFFFGDFIVNEENPYFKSVDGILYSYDGKTLLKCPSHNKELSKIPDSVEVIGENAFCFNQSGICPHLPKSLKVIEAGAFNNFLGLSYIEIPAGVEIIGDFAFQETDLETVALPKGLKKLGASVFQWTKISNIIIPSSVESIADLGLMSFLTSISCKGSVPPEIGNKESFIENVSWYNNQAVKLVVPKGSLEVYKNDECWGLFSVIVEEESVIGEEGEKCAVPTIQFIDGKLVCTTATDGAECVTTISAPDTGTYKEGEIPLQGIYKISTYANKHGFIDSDVVTATLYWIEKELKPDGMDAGAIQANARPVIVSSTGNTLTVQGAEDGESVTAYALDGRQLGSRVCRNGQTTLRLNAKPGSVILMKIGNSTVKIGLK